MEGGWVGGNGREEVEAALGAVYSSIRATEGALGGGEGVEGIYGTITRVGTERVLTRLLSDAPPAEGGLSAAAAAAEEEEEEEEEAGAEAGAGVSSSTSSSSSSSSPSPSPSSQKRGGPPSREGVRLADVGAGLGRPLLHALAGQGVRDLVGFEVDPVKVSKAEAVVDRATAHLGRAFPGRFGGVAPPIVKCIPVEEVGASGDFRGVTHVYSFWEGIPEASRRALGGLCASPSSSVTGVAVVQRAVRGRKGAEGLLAGLGFGHEFTLTATEAVAMAGSGRSFAAYVFHRPWRAPTAEVADGRAPRKEAGGGKAAAPWKAAGPNYLDRAGRRKRIAPAGSLKTFFAARKRPRA